MSVNLPVLVTLGVAACAGLTPSRACSSELHLIAHVGTTPADAKVRAAQARVEADPSAQALVQLGWAFVGVARRTQDPGHYTLARSCAEAAIVRNNEDLDALLLRGHVLHSQHRFAEAERVARQLLDRRGLWVDLALLGDALVDLGKLDEAADAYQRMMDAKPGPLAYGRAAHLRWLRGDLAGAIELMARAARSVGPDAETEAWHRVRLGELILPLGRADAVRDLATSALELVPGFPPALLLAGTCDVVQGLGSRACDTLREAVNACPEPRYLWALIEAQRQAGRAAEARATETELLRRGAATDARTLALYLATTERQSLQAVRLATNEMRSRRDVHTLDALAWALFRAELPYEALPIARLAVAHETVDARLLLHAAIIETAVGEDSRGRELRERLRALERALWPSERALVAGLDASLQNSVVGKRR